MSAIRPSGVQVRRQWFPSTIRLAHLPPTVAPAPAAPLLSIRRVHDPASPDDGCRVLVDRLWPRGLRREQVAADLWLRDIAPSGELRKWFAHDAGKWGPFVERYHAELDANPQAVRRLEALLRVHGRLTLLYAARDPVHNHAAALLDYLCRPAPDGAAAARELRDPEGLRRRLRDEHARMLRLVGDARVALLRGDVADARAAFDAMVQVHGPHARLEETALFPALPRAARWPRRTYEAEHAALERALGELRASLQELPERIRSPRRRLELVDAALPLQHLLEHHFEREEKGLFVEISLPGEPDRPATA